jgi:hypothetical protein
MRLVLRRKGTFNANWSDTHTMCGFPEEILGTKILSYRYNYECTIEADSSLDTDGFIIDQLALDRYFQVKYHHRQVAKSCERLALQAVKDVAELLRTKGMTSVFRIAVTISFNDLASMTAEWTKENDSKKRNLPKDFKYIQYDHNLRRDIYGHADPRARGRNFGLSKVQE